MMLQIFKKKKSLSLIYKYRKIIIYGNLIENVLKIKKYYFFLIVNIIKIVTIVTATLND